MTRIFLAAGVAALAIAAPVAAQPGGKGGENKGQAAKAERGGKGAAKADRKGGQRAAVAQRGKGRDMKSDRRGNRIQVRDDDRRIVRADRKGRDGVRVRGDDRFDDVRFGRRVASRGLIDGCPPGLWKKNPPCVPPGQARNAGLLGRVIPSAFRDRRVPLGLRDLYRDTDDYYYRLGDGGYLYQVDRRNNLIEALLPLLGGGLVAGQMFPSSYSNYYVPQQYRAFYPDTQDDYFRFANGYVYEIDRNSGMIESAIPLMAGGYGVGQMLPAGYSAYNVPYQYRGLYPDAGNYQYRYAPGAIYRVDPSTSLITAVASLLTGGLSVGQPLPMGYSAYNVPLAYRANYYDTPNAMYRYNDGYIYQVDPTTRLITAVIDAIV